MTASGGFDDRDALLQQARDLRAQQRVPDALVTLARLEGLHPGFSRLYHERGQCLVQLRDAPGAIAALETAVRLNPALPASWDMLEQLHRLQGDPARAATAAQHLATLGQLPPEVVMANCLLADGDLEPAGQVIGDFLRRDPDNVGALRLLARIRLEAGAADVAEGLLDRVLKRAPDYHAARFDYVMVLLQQEKHAPARRETERLLRSDPDNRDYLKQSGLASIGLGDYESVIDLYARLLSPPDLSGTEIADLRLWRANALKTTGRLPEAIEDYHASLAARPDNSVAWFSLSNLKTYRFTDADIARMRAALCRPDLQPMDGVYLGFALGKALEDRGDNEASWGSYARANAARRKTCTYRPEVTAACADRLRQVFTAEVFARRQGWGDPDAAPIFVLGLPRSGSTLIEQILASHSRVEGTQELTEIDQFMGEICGRDPQNRLPLHPEAVLALTSGDVRALGARFLAQTRAYRREGCAFFIDKMPNNFWHIGLIQLILPKARIIDVRRAPMACGFSNFKQLFGGSNQEFAYDLQWIAGYYRAYLDLMQHWDRVLPERVLRVSHEDLVADPEAGVRRLLEQCGLPFEPACLAFHETRRSVRTPSSEQVRRPMDREGLNQWRRFEPWLQPLEAALGDAMTRYRT
jgi:tetratricopeptide (TPR) repeat protein